MSEHQTDTTGDMVIVALCFGPALLLTAYLVGAVLWHWLA